MVTRAPLVHCDRRFFARDGLFASDGDRCARVNRTPWPNDRRRRSAVEIWLNTYYRVTTPSIPAGGRFQVGLDSFVAGFGQRFDYRRAQVSDLRLTAKLPDGKPLELKKQFAAGGLAGMLGGKR